MDKKILALSIGTLLTAGNIYADNATIINANNQAFIDGQFGYEQLTYSSNRPGDAGGPLYNAHGVSSGAQLGLTKTFGHIYSQFALDANQSTLNYSDSLLSATPLSRSKSVTLSLDARLGYSFFVKDTLAVTPYVLGGYAQNQLNTGGFSAPFFSSAFNGTTFVTQSFYYGLGVLNQWAATPQWVLSADIQLGTQLNPWVNGNVNNFNNQASATTTYQKWSLTPSLLWQIGLGSDYLVANNLHLRTDLAYGQNKLSGVTTNDNGVFPSQIHAHWLGTVGLGYNFADFKLDESNLSAGDQETIHSVNNQGTLHLGYQTQNFKGGTTAYPYHLMGGMPAFGMALSKTWNALYTQIAATEALGTTSSQVPNANTTTHNTALDASGKLGYVIASSHNTALTPYATLGYHRGSQNIQGTPTTESSINNVIQTYYVNGVSETYQHSWYGVGLRAQWAALPRLVLTADGNIGRTFNGNMRSWTPLSLPVNTSYSLGNANYQMAALGADYLLGKNWHVQGNVSYWNYSYNPSSANAFGISTLTDRVHQVSIDLGIGYSFA